MSKMITRQDLINKAIITNNICELTNTYSHDFIIKVNQNNYNIFTDYKIYFICVNKEGKQNIKILENVEIFLDIRKENSRINNQLMNSYQTISEKSTRIEKVNLKPFDYYSEKPIPHDRIYFKSLYNYKFIN